MVDEIRVITGEQEVKYSDLHFAAFLKTAGCMLKRHERKGKRIFFIFEKTPGIKKLKEEYWNRSAKVIALNYADNLRSLKSLCYIDEEEEG